MHEECGISNSPNPTVFHRVEKRCCILVRRQTEQPVPEHGELERGLAEREGLPGWAGTNTAQHLRSVDFSSHWGDFSSGVAVVRPGQMRKQDEGWGWQVS